MLTKKFSIDDIGELRDTDDVDFATCEMWFMAEGGNSHKNPISLDVLVRDAESVKGKFLVCHFDKWTKDATTHTLSEVITGYVSPNAEVSFKQKDGKTFAVVDALLSKIYATEIYKAFKEANNRSVSCEFSCTTEREEDESNQRNEIDNPITSFKIHSICILGLKYNPSISGAEMKIKQFAEKLNGSPLKQFAQDRKSKLEDKGSEEMKVKKFATVDLENLWSSIYSKLEERYPCSDYGSIYRIKGIYEEEGVKFTILRRKDEQQMYKLIFTCEESGLSFEETMVEVDHVYIEKETVLKFENPDNISAYKDFAEIEKEDAKPDEEDKQFEEKEEVEVEKEKEEEPPKEEEKEFSLDANIDSAAYLAMLENETEAYKGLATELWECKSYNLVMEKCLAVTKEKDEMAKEMAELKSFKQAKDDEAKSFAVEKVLSDAKEDLTVEKFAELKAQGLDCEIGQISAWENTVKAFAYEASKTKKTSKKKADVMRFGYNNPVETKPSDLTPDDIFKKYLG